jgi:hypothetical protein
MPETVTTSETPAQKTMRRWYEGKLAERLLQAGSMAKNRAMLRRGALKMQNGTLGTAVEGEDMGDDAVNISIGDQIIYQTSTPDAKPEAAPAAEAEPAPPSLAATAKDAVVSKGKDWLKTAALSAALLAAGGGLGAGIPWLAGLFDKPPAGTPAFTDTDTDTQYTLSIKPSQ